MVFHCAAAQCSASGNKLDRLNVYPWMRGVRFFKFPPDKQARWTRLCKRGGKENGHEDKFQITRHTRICSCHFEAFDVSGNPVGDPTLWMWNNYGQSVNARPVTAIQKRETVGTSQGSGSGTYHSCL